MAGDAVLQINNRASDELEHEQAKQEIIASGNNVFLVVQRSFTIIINKFLKSIIVFKFDFD